MSPKEAQDLLLSMKPWLGFRMITSPTTATRSTVGFDSSTRAGAAAGAKGGVLVEHIHAHGPAEAAGLREGDVIELCAGMGVSADHPYHPPQGAILVKSAV